jgi:hypothetical protein
VNPKLSEPIISGGGGGTSGGSKRSGDRRSACEDVMCDWKISCVISVVNYEVCVNQR